PVGDDPRIPPRAGLRRRGYTPEALRDFAERVGTAKAAKVVDIALLEHCLREHLNRRAERRLAVLRPLKLVIENYPEGQVEEMEAVNNPEDPSAGSRKGPLSRVLHIEQEAFPDRAPPARGARPPGGGGCGDPSPGCPRPPPSPPRCACTIISSARPGRTMRRT